MVENKGLIFKDISSGDSQKTGLSCTDGLPEQINLITQEKAHRLGLTIVWDIILEVDFRIL